MKSLAVTCITICSLFFQAQLFAKQTESYKTLLEQGHQAFQEQNYKEALVFYARSYQLNELDSSLYNMAICHYKLKNWSQALHAFKQLAPKEGSQDVVNYQIALIYKKQKHYLASYNAFKRFSENSSNEKLVVVAKKQLKNIADNFLTEKELAKIKPKQPSLIAFDKLTGSAAFNVGYEDDVIAPEADEVEGEGDIFTEKMISGSLINNSFSSGKWSIDASYYANNYNEATEYDMSVLSFATRKYFQFNLKTKLYLGTSYSSIKLGGDDYTNNINLFAGAKYKLNKYHSFTLQYNYKTINEDQDTLSHLAGSGHYLKGIWRQHTSDGDLTVTSQFYNLDRNDKYEVVDEQEYFTSYSQQRFSIQAERGWEIKDFYIALIANYSTSTFADPNIVAGEQIFTREDSVYTLSAEADYQISKKLSLTAEVSYTDFDSNIDDLIYQQSFVMTGLSYYF